MSKQRLTITMDGDLSSERVREVLGAVTEIYERPSSTIGGWGIIPGVGYKWTVESAAPGERTPEVVLRAMLRAYEAAALEAWAVYLRTCPDTGAAAPALARFERMDHARSRLLCETGSVIAWGDPHHHLSGAALADYEARLAGTTPLDAPPAEVP